MSARDRDLRLCVECDLHTDTIHIRHPKSLRIVATRIRKEGSTFIWKASNPTLQAVCDEWSGGSTAGGLAEVLWRYMTEVEKRGEQLP